MNSNATDSLVGGLIEEGEAFAQKAGAEEIVAFASGRQSLQRSVWYSGWLLTFLATGEETRGQFALMEQIARKGNVPPRHIHHREDETFYVVEGEMTFFIGDETIKATPGTMVFAPRDVAHSFTIDSEQVRILVMVAPAGAEGFFRVQCTGTFDDAAATDRNTV